MVGRQGGRVGHRQSGPFSQGCHHDTMAKERLDPMRSPLALMLVGVSLAVLLLGG